MTSIGECEYLPGHDKGVDGISYFKNPCPSVPPAVIPY